MHSHRQMTQHNAYSFFLNFDHFTSIKNKVLASKKNNFVTNRVTARESEIKQVVVEWKKVANYKNVCILNTNIFHETAIEYDDF